MNFAPFLLQAFAARVLATKQEAMVSRAELLKQGYDIDVLVEMIEAYGALPEDKRGFLVRATAEEIVIRRKTNSAAPIVPTLGAAPNSSTTKPAAPAIAAAPVRPVPGKPAVAAHATAPRNGHAAAPKSPAPANLPAPRAKRAKPDSK